MANCPQIPLFPYYGIAAADAAITPSLILNLPNRGPAVSRKTRSFHVLDGEGMSLYYAYPASYGLATFKNLISGEAVEWNGMRRASSPTLGPFVIELDFNGIPVQFYLYQAPRPNMSPERKTVFWEVL